MAFKTRAALIDMLGDFNTGQRYHVLINFVASSDTITTSGGTAITSAGAVDLRPNTRVQAQAITGALPSPLNSTQTYFVGATLSTTVFNLAAEANGSPFTIAANGTSTILFTEQRPCSEDELPIWVVHEVTDPNYARFPFTFASPSYNTSTNIVASPTVFATHTAGTSLAIAYTHGLVIYNGAGSAVGGTSGTADSYEDFGIQSIPAGGTYTFPVESQLANVDPNTPGNSGC